MQEIKTIIKTAYGAAVKAVKIGWNFLLDLIFPPKCVFCRELLTKNESGFCRECGKSLPFTEGAHSVITGEFFDKCCAPMYYQDSVRSAFIRYKFNGQMEYSGLFAQLMVDTIKDELGDDFDYVTWVPLSLTGRLKRGYSQTHLLAKDISKLLGVEMRCTLLKIRHTKKQSSIKEPEERKANVLGAFRAIRDVKGKKILLIDDIYTTGATMSECARCLKTAGAEKVSAAVFARRPRI